MELSTHLFTVAQATIALSSAHIARLSPDDEHGILSATGPNANELIARDCWYGASYGCTKGYRWQTCQTGGKWCWLATQNGNGPWFTCRNDNRCAPGITTRGAACGKGNCDAYGCSY